MNHEYTIYYEIYRLFTNVYHKCQGHCAPDIRLRGIISRFSHKLLYPLSETLPWWTALSSSIILLGHSDGSVNVVDVESRGILTIQQQESGIMFLQLVLDR